jgi:hypothetical protein
MHSLVLRAKLTLRLQGTYNGCAGLRLRVVILQNSPRSATVNEERVEPSRRETTASARAPRRTRRLPSRCMEPSSSPDTAGIKLRAREVKQSRQKSKSSSPSFRPDRRELTTTFKPELELGLGRPRGRVGMPASAAARHYRPPLGAGCAAAQGCRTEGESQRRAEGRLPCCCVPTPPLVLPRIPADAGERRETARTEGWGFCSGFLGCYC